MQQTKHLIPIKNDGSAERNLWVAVLRRAFKDLHRFETQHGALKFFADKNGMFSWICEMLGVEADHIRNGILCYSEKIKIDSRAKNPYSATCLLPRARLIPERQVTTSHLFRPRHISISEVNNRKRGQRIWSNQETPHLGAR